MLEVKAYKIDYKKLNKKCAYCDAAATMIRITTLTDGTLRVSTMCDFHAEGEKKRAFLDGFKMAGESSIAGAVTDATLIDEDVLQEMKQAAIQMTLGFKEG